MQEDHCCVYATEQAMLYMAILVHHCIYAMYCIYQECRDHQYHVS